MKNLNWVLAGLLVLVAIGMSVLVVYTTTQRALNPIESILWQVFVLTTGLAGSFIFGRQSAYQAAKEIIKPHARSAFRRLIFLYLTLRRAATAIESAQHSEPQENYQVILARLEEIVTAQLMTADDALGDWDDIVPEDVEELKQKLQSEDILEDGQ
jgi:hypothetical protein